MGSTARSPRVRTRVTPHRGQGESLVPLYTRESVSLSLSLWDEPHPHLAAKHLLDVLLMPPNDSARARWTRHHRKRTYVVVVITLRMGPDLRVSRYCM